MRKAFAILFLTAYLFGTTEASQLLRLPLLVTHYLEHKQGDADLTIKAFLKMHYVDPQLFDDDYKQDMQLPFKTMQDALYSVAPTILPVSHSYSFMFTAPAPEKPDVLNDAVPEYLLPHTIFQPPKA